MNELGTWTVRPDGTNWRRLNDCTVVDLDTNGRKLIAVYDQDVLVLPASGKDLSNLGECADGRNVALRRRYRLNVKGLGKRSVVDISWSSDSRRVLVVEYVGSGANRVGRVGVFSANGSGHRLVSPKGDIDPSPGSSVASAAWSPSRDRIALSRSRYSSECLCAQSEIVVMNSDGTNAQLIYGPADAAIMELDWHRERIVFSLVDAANGVRVAAVNADGTGYSALTPLLPGASFTPHPAWSQDGRQIALLWKKRASTAAPRVYLMNPNGGSLRELRLRPDRRKTLCPPPTICTLFDDIDAISW